ncbi:T9SS type A sorting domain-containing protein [Porphyromonas crevioricanis]|nr:T9SS type A sorting domain-containing protein [Porphyromonas crevioricanis]
MNNKNDMKNLTHSRMLVLAFALLTLSSISFDLSAQERQEENVIKLTTSIPVGKKISFWLRSKDEIKIEGVENSGVLIKPLKEEEEFTFRVSNPEIKIIGPVIDFSAVKQQLISLDLSGINTLVNVSCNNNQIRELDFSSNKGVQRLDIYGNIIRNENMTKMLESLPKASNSKCELYVIDSKNRKEWNISTKADVAIATKKGWDVRDLRGDYINISETDNGEEYEGETTLPEKFFTVTFKPTTNGEIRIEGDQDLSRLALGAELAVTATPANGYELDKLLVNENLDIRSLKRFVVDGDIELSAVFREVGSISKVANNNLRLYPTVAKDIVSIKMAIANEQVFVFTVDGHIVANTYTNAEGSVVLNVSDWAKGLYIVKAGTQTSKLVKD